jgi:hypothetical protein
MCKGYVAEMETWSWTAVNNQNYNKTTLIRNNWEQFLVHISESPNCSSTTENMFRKL